MATDKQISANRRNAKKSTGPRTAGGKQRVSRNATKHGLASPPDEHEVGRIADKIVAEIADGATSNFVREQVRGVAESEHTIQRARAAKAKLLGDANDGADWIDRLDQYGRLDRYERRALSRKKMLLRQLVAKPAVRRPGSQH